ncbi:MAG: DUF167 domain-containing protein [Janthinobacterium lividum]
MSGLDLRDNADGCLIPIRVHPAARKNAITGVHGGALKISLTAPPTDGRANEALLKLLAQTLGIARAQLALVSGASSRTKAVQVRASTASEIARRLTS